MWSSAAEQQTDESLVFHAHWFVQRGEEETRVVMRTAAAEAC
jgi:hypothetical protein